MTPDGVAPDTGGGDGGGPGDADATTPDTSPPRFETAAELDGPTLPGCILEGSAELQYRCRAAENA